MIVVVRHGQTAVNRDRRFQGRHDVDLTDRGRRQAAAAGAALARERPTRLLTSPLVRARATAAAVGESCGVAVEVDDRLVELDYGEWDGRALSDVDPAAWARWRTEPDFAPPGGESLLDLERRVVALLEAVRGGDGVVLVTHVSPVKAAVAWALGGGVDLTWRLHVDLASITRLEIRGDTTLLRSFNETAHLTEVAAVPGFDAP